MIKTFLNSYKNLDKQTFRILKKGFIFCSILCLSSILTLFTYMSIIHNPFIYYIGIAIFKLSITFAIEFLICAIVVDSIKKQLI